SRQLIGQLEPGKLRVHISVVTRRHALRLVERARRDVHVLRRAAGLERELRAATRTERPLAVLRRREACGLALGHGIAGGGNGDPRDERCATGAPARGAVTERLEARVAVRLVADEPATATAAQREMTHPSSPAKLSSTPLPAGSAKKSCTWPVSGTRP